MRVLLAPVEVAEKCTLRHACEWVQYRAYPVDEYFYWLVQDAYAEIDFDPSSPPYYMGQEPGGEYGRERAHEELFSALRRGQLSAVGRFSDQYALDERGAPAPAAENWIDQEWKEPSDEPTVIPADFWHMNGVQWDRNVARSPTGEFRSIEFATDDLLRAFPERAPSEIIVEVRGPFLVLTRELIAKSKKRTLNRKPKYNWDEFYAEIAARAATSGLPAKQTAFEAEMLEWCERRWGGEPSVGAVRQRIAPIYRAFRERDKEKNPKE